jgi:hypothetical protein
VDGQNCANDKHDPHCNNSAHRQKRQKNKLGNKETLCCCPVPYICMDIDGADQYLSYYSILRKNVKWLKSAKLYTLQGIFVYKTLNTTKNEVQELPA